MRARWTSLTLAVLDRASLVNSLSCSSVATKRAPRLCRGGRKSLTVAEVGHGGRRLVHGRARADVDVEAGDGHRQVGDDTSLGEWCGQRTAQEVSAKRPLHEWHQPLRAAHNPNAPGFAGGWFPTMPPRMGERHPVERTPLAQRRGRVVDVPNVLQCHQIGWQAKSQTPCGTALSAWRAHSPSTCSSCIWRPTGMCMSSRDCARWRIASSSTASCR